MFRAKNPPDAILTYYLKAPATSAVTVRVEDVTGAVVREFDAPREAGIHRIAWDLRRPGPSGVPGNDPAAMLGARIEPGTYVVRLSAGGRTLQQTLTVVADPNR